MSGIKAIKSMRMRSPDGARDAKRHEAGGSCATGDMGDPQTTHYSKGLPDARVEGDKANDDCSHEIGEENRPPWMVLPRLGPQTTQRATHAARQTAAWAGHAQCIHDRAQLKIQTMRRMPRKGRQQPDQKQALAKGSCGHRGRHSDIMT